jgi:hypothetical protein
MVVSHFNRMERATGLNRSFFQPLAAKLLAWQRKPTYGFLPDIRISTHVLAFAWLSMKLT